MSQVTPLTVTLELPASEFMDHDSGPMVRCPVTRTWVPMADYYSENEGALLPLVGNAAYDNDGLYWKDTGEVDENGAPIMTQEQGEVIHWAETVRVLAAPPEAPAEGGTLQFGVSETVGTGDVMG